MKNKGGRKSYFEELNIADRYSALSEPYFKFLKRMIESEEIADQKWAAERLEKAYVKMIPQDITSGGKELPQPIISLDGLLRDHITQENSETDKED